MIIKIGILGMKGFEKHMEPLIPQGVEIELIFALRAAVSEIRADFRNRRIWA